MPIIPYAPYLKRNAGTLRKNMTPQERKLWYEFLRELSPRFVRQKPLGNCIVDFYCPTCRVAVEVDGGQHFEEVGQTADAERTKALERLGVTVIRISNLDVDREFDAVCRLILATIEKK